MVDQMSDERKQLISDLYDRRAEVLRQQDLHPLSGSLAQEYIAIEQEIVRVSLTEPVVCDRVMLLHE